MKEFLIKFVINLKFCSVRMWVLLHLGLILITTSLCSQSSFIKRPRTYASNFSYYQLCLPINDSIGISEIVTFGLVPDSILIAKNNYRRHQYSSRYIKTIYDTSKYRIESRTYDYDKYFNQYFICNYIVYNSPNTYITSITKVDTGFNIIWSYQVPGKYQGNFGGKNSFIDSFFYLMTNITNGNSNYDYRLLYKINTQGNILKTKKVSKNWQQMIMRDTFLFILNDSGMSRFNRELVPDLTISGPTFGSQYTFFEPKNSLYLSGYNGISPKIEFMALDLKYMYRIQSVFITKPFLKSINIARNGEIELLIGNFKYQESYGFKHIIINSNKKTIKKSVFYALPDIGYSDPWSYYKTEINLGASYQHGGFMNDSSLMFYTPVRNSGYSSFYHNQIYIKNRDYSIFPYSKTVCDEDIWIDSVATTQRGHPIYKDTSITRDTFNQSLVVGSWNSIAYDSVNMFTDIGTLNARFTLVKDTYCATRIDLRSDTAVKQGQSIWNLRYLDAGYFETLNVKDTLNYLLKRSGRVEIEHLHIFYGCIDTFKDTVYYSVPTTATIKKDTLVCSPINMLLNAKNLNYQSYLWNTGSTDTAITVVDTGTYWVKKTGACSTKIDTVRLSYKTAINNNPVFSLDSVILCGKNLPYTLSSGITGGSYSYTWSPSFGNLSSRSISTFGMYTLTVTDGCHTYKDSFRLIALSVASPPNIPDSVSLCNTTYKIYRPINLTLEEQYVSNAPMWINRDSLTLAKNQKLVFRWTDSCGAITYDSIYDYQKGSFTPLSKSILLCETYQSSIVNTQSSTIVQSEWVSNQYLVNNNITLKVGKNYIRRDDMCGNIQYDTVVGYSAKATKQIIEGDTLKKCTKDFPFTLKVSDTFLSYIWNEGSTNKTFKVSSEGLVTVIVTDNCYEYRDSIYISEIKSSTENPLTQDKIELCLSSKQSKIETALIYPIYIWNSVSSSSRFFIADTSYKKIILQIPRVCDTLQDSMFIEWINPLIPSPQIIVDSSYCDSPEGAIKITIVNVNDYKYIRWSSTNSESPFQFVNSYSSSAISLSNQCNNLTYTIPPYYCPLSPIGLPSGFSPNGNGINDFWRMDGSKSIIIHKLFVFNRMGEKVFEADNPNFAWDGRYKGEIVPIGVYTYYIYYEYIMQKIRKELKGTVTVIR